MYKRYTILFIVLAAALGGYGIYWFMAANRASEALPQTLASVMPEGLSIKYSKMERSGFPFRIIFTIENLEITGEGGNRLATDQVETVMQPTNSRHMIFRLPSPVRYALADAQNGGLYSGVLTAERFLASAIALGCENDGFRLYLDARDLVI
ncbi:MAG: DUF2125 domain-containing protein [Alphaproteobacteria bacterium]|nr:DUF2125 domain-containing protein [Alphaproteobacteria bacterium]